MINWIRKLTLCAMLLPVLALAGPVAAGELYKWTTSRVTSSTATVRPMTRS